MLSLAPGLVAIAEAGSTAHLLARASSPASRGVLRCGAARWRATLWGRLATEDWNPFCQGFPTFRPAARRCEHAYEFQRPLLCPAAFLAVFSAVHLACYVVGPHAWAG
jgi:hypothetical protein